MLGCGAPAAGEPEASAQAARPSSQAAAEIDPSAKYQPVEVPDLGTREAGTDWPDFLGPRRDGKSSETGILTKWPEGGPRIVWTRKLGTSYGIGTISRGRYFQFDRFGDQMRIYCLNSETGEPLWQFEFPTDYDDLLGYNNGPRCSPIVDGDRVYAMSSDGMLYCVRATDGRPIWHVYTQKKYGVVQNFFGVGSTPIIEGDLLIANIGGSPPNSPAMYSGRVVGKDSGIVAFDKYTGEEVYRLTDELASYAGPVMATIDGRRWGFVFARGGLVGFDPASGEKRFHFPWRADKLESVNASTPVVIGDRVFLTETYGPGAAMLQIEGDDYKVLWTDERRRRDKAMQCHWNTPIYIDGYIYGSSGRHTANAELRCIDARDGSVQWSEPGLGRSTLLYVDGHFVCLSEYGTLRLIRVNPKKYEPVAEVLLLNPDDGRPLLRYPAWAAPILSHGLLYVRGKTHLVCLELIPEK
jgi:outer membrane protein assembly factor BamB